jgi:hypothetical protein
MAGQNLVLGIDQDWNGKPELFDAGGDLAELFRRMSPRIGFAGGELRQRNKLSPWTRSPALRPSDPVAAAKT